MSIRLKPGSLPYESFAARQVQSKSSPNFQLSLELDARAVLRVLGFAIGVLTALHLASMYLYFRNPNWNIADIVYRFFALGREGNLPTMFSCLILFTASCLLFYLHRLAKAQGKKYLSTRWLVLSCVLLFLCIDEGAMVHDFLTDSVRNKMPTNLPPYLYIAWVVPYAVLTIVVGAYFLPFLWKLPAQTRLYFIIAGVLYVVGALGFEMLESVDLSTGEKTLRVHLLETVEEVLEMGSIAFFIYALLAYVNLQHGILLISGKKVRKADPVAS